MTEMLQTAEKWEICYGWHQIQHHWKNI
jgi:hypothetical protein